MSETIDRGHPDRAEERCDRCGGSNPTWWVDSDRWRIACTAFGGTVDNPGDNPFLCPSCFVALWEQQTGFVTVWHLQADPAVIRTRGHDQWMREHALRSILRIEKEAGLRPDPDHAFPGYVWCEDPTCSDWYRDEAGQDRLYWNHTHPMGRTVCTRCAIESDGDAVACIHRRGDTSHAGET